MSLEWSPDPENEAEEEAPPPVTLVDGTLRVAVVEAAGLKKMDRFGDNDVYCLLALGGARSIDNIYRPDV
eukprot:COSAG01_NODE_1404_length_10443_cov_29.217517_11_plen_70_part_00